MKLSVTLSAVFLYLALVVALGAGVRERVRYREAVGEVSSLRDRNRHLETHREALLDFLTRMDLESPFLRSEIGFGIPSDGFLLEEPTDVVLYLLSTDCPICPRNYAFLNELFDSGASVIGLAVDSVASTVEDHASEWGVKFPILVSAIGSGVDVVPRYGTPTTVAVSGGRVQFLEFGEIDPDSREKIKAIAGSWMRHEGPNQP